MFEHATVHDTVQPVEANAAAAPQELNAETDRHEDVPARHRHDDVPAHSSIERPTQHSDLLAEAKRYRKRAQAAEKTLEDRKHDLAERQKKIAEHEQTIARLQRKTALDHALIEAQAIDMDAARTLADSALAQMTEPDVAKAVHDLRQRRPYLFGSLMRRGKAGAGAMSPRGGLSSDSPHAAAVDRAASEAVSTGRRSDLLRYLRLRRRT
jgi:hypothetical protein